MNMMVPLKLELLNEGLFLKEVESAFAELQTQALAYGAKYKKEAIGKKSKLTIEIEMKHLSVELNDYSITTNTKKALPQPPAITTRGIGDCDKDGAMILFVRQEGSGFDTPRQQTIPMGSEKESEK